jgi:hypothetical protein
MVLTLGVRHARTRDPEEGHAASVRAAHLDGLKLSSTHQAVGTQEEIVGLQHRHLLSALRTEPPRPGNPVKGNQRVLFDPSK